MMGWEAYVFFRKRDCGRCGVQFAEIGVQRPKKCAVFREQVCNLCAILTTKKRKSLKINGFRSKKVSKMRVELTRPIGHYPLKVARLPIPPPGQKRERKTGLGPATPTLARSCSTN